MKVNKSMRQILQLGQHIPGQRYRLVNERLETVERDMRDLVNSKMNMSQQCDLADNRASYSLEFIIHVIANRSREVIAPTLLCSGVDSP